MNVVALLLTLLLSLLQAFGAHAQKFPFYNLGIESGLIQSQVTSLAQDSLGHLWIGTLGGLSRYDGRSFTNYTSRDGLPANTITALAIGQDGQVWIGTTKGACTYDGRQFTGRPAPANLSSGLFRNVPASMVTRSGQHWAADASGGVIVDQAGQHTRSYNAANGLTDNRVLAMLEDREGNIWLGTDGQGLFRFSGAPFLSVDRVAGLPSAQIMALAPIENGRVYLGTYDAGLFLLEAGKALRIPMPGNAVAEVTGMARYGNEVFIGTRTDGLLRANGTRLIPVDDRQAGLPRNTATLLRTSTDGRLYAGFPEGLWAWDGQRWDTVVTATRPIQDVIRLGDSLLLGTTEGNRLLHGGRLVPWITHTAADSAQSSCFAASGPWLFIGTTDNGLIAYNRVTGKARTLNTTSGLRSDFVYNILVPSDSVVWIGTGYGIHRITISRSGPWRVEHFGQERGVSGMESNHLAAAIAPDGSLWFGTTNGAVQYRGDSAVRARPVSLVLQSVKVFGEDIRDSAFYTSRSPVYGAPIGLRLPWRMNNLTLAFQAVTLTGGQPVEYRYRMMGVDAAWSDWSPVTTVTYSNLPAGKREFVAQCRVGDLTGPELRYRFEIITPFQQTGLFRLVLIGGLILIGVGIQFQAHRRRNRRAQLVEQLRREEQALVRQRTAEDFHDEVGNRITRINVLAGILKSRLPKEATDAGKLVEQIKDNAGQLYSGTRDILWSLTPANDSLYEIVHRIRDFGHDLFGDTDVLFSFEGNDERWREVRMPMDASRNLIMIFKEAMNNALKYARASEVSLRATAEGGQATIAFSDNGGGFPAGTPQNGNGLKNMRIRAERIGGKLAVTSGRTGTSIALSFKIPPSKAAGGGKKRSAL